MSEKQSITRYTDVRVRYQETDKMGIVYHSNYFNWFEVGRNEFFREAGMPYTVMEAQGILFPLVSCSARFLKAAGYDDVLAIATRVVGLSPVKMNFSYSVEKDGFLCATGETCHVFVDGEGKPFNLKKRFPEVWQELERIVYMA